MRSLKKSKCPGGKAKRFTVLFTIVLIHVEQVLARAVSVLDYALAKHVETPRRAKLQGMRHLPAHDTRTDQDLQCLTTRVAVVRKSKTVDLDAACRLVVC